MDKDPSPTKATSPKDTPIVKDEKTDSRPEPVPQIDRQATEVAQPQPKTEPEAKPEQEPEPLHRIDQHTGEGTAFPVGSAMAVVPPSRNQAL